MNKSPVQSLVVQSQNAICFKNFFVKPHECEKTFPGSFSLILCHSFFTTQWQLVRRQKQQTNQNWMKMHWFCTQGIIKWINCVRMHHTVLSSQNVEIWKQRKMSPRCTQSDPYMNIIKGQRLYHNSAPGKLLWPVKTNKVLLISTQRQLLPPDAHACKTYASNTNDWNKIIFSEN